MIDSDRSKGPASNYADVNYVKVFPGGKKHGVIVHRTLTLHPWNQYHRILTLRNMHETSITEQRHCFHGTNITGHQYIGSMHATSMS